MTCNLSFIESFYKQAFCFYILSEIESITRKLSAKTLLKVNQAVLREILKPIKQMEVIKECHKAN